jgi:hypothetical protein
MYISGAHWPCGTSPCPSPVPSPTWLINHPQKLHSPALHTHRAPSVCQNAGVDSNCNESRHKQAQCSDRPAAAQICTHWPVSDSCSCIRMPKCSLGLHLSKQRRVQNAFSDERAASALQWLQNLLLGNHVRVTCVLPRQLSTKLAPQLKVHI